MPERHQLSFVVTGAGRSGTGYTAKLLTELGFPCTHEGVFFPCAEISADKFVGPEPRPWGESSWMAAAALDSLPEGTLVLHQVRNPVAVIRSHMGIQFFQKPNAYTELALGFTTTLRWDDYAIVKCMKFWVEWNRKAEAATPQNLRYFRYRLEDLCEPATGVLAYVVGKLDGAIDGDRLARAVAAVPREYNSRERDRSITWETLPAVDAKKAVMSLALEYGYNAEEVERA